MSLVRLRYSSSFTSAFNRYTRHRWQSWSRSRHEEYRSHLHLRAELFSSQCHLFPTETQSVSFGCFLSCLSQTTVHVLHTDQSSEHSLLFHKYAFDLFRSGWHCTVASTTACRRTTDRSTIQSEQFFLFRQRSISIFGRQESWSAVYRVYSRRIEEELDPIRCGIRTILCANSNLDTVSTWSTAINSQSDAADLHACSSSDGNIAFNSLQLETTRSKHHRTPNRPGIPTVDEWFMHALRKSRDRRDWFAVDHAVFSRSNSTGVSSASTVSDRWKTFFYWIPRSTCIRAGTRWSQCWTLAEFIQELLVQMRSIDAFLTTARLTGPRWPVRSDPQSISRRRTTDRSDAIFEQPASGELLRVVETDASSECPAVGERERTIDVEWSDTNHWRMPSLSDSEKTDWSCRNKSAIEDESTGTDHRSGFDQKSTIHQRVRLGSVI